MVATTKSALPIRDTTYPYLLGSLTLAADIGYRIIVGIRDAIVPLDLIVIIATPAILLLILKLMKVQAITSKTTKLIGHIDAVVFCILLIVTLFALLIVYPMPDNLRSDQKSYVAIINMLCAIIALIVVKVMEVTIERSES